MGESSHHGRIDSRRALALEEEIKSSVIHAFFYKYLAGHNLLRVSQVTRIVDKCEDFAQPKVSSTWYMCPWEHFRAYGVEIDGRSGAR